jgi:hypothetical protein
MSELILQLPDDILNRLQSEAARQQIPVGDLARAVIEQYLDEDEPTKEELLEGLRQALRDVRDGRVRPAREFLAELRQELGDDDNDS